MGCEEEGITPGLRRLDSMNMLYPFLGKPGSLEGHIFKWQMKSDTAHPHQTSHVQEINLCCIMSLRFQGLFVTAAELS